MLCKRWHYGKMKSHTTQNAGRNTSFTEEARSHGRGERRKAGICSCVEGGTQLSPSPCCSLQRRADLLPGFMQHSPSLLILLFPPYSFREQNKVRDTTAKVCGTEVRVPALLAQLLPSQALCPEPAGPLTASQESFHAWFSKAFRCLRTHRDKRNFKHTLSLVFPVTWKVLSVSENLTQH